MLSPILLFKAKSYILNYCIWDIHLNVSFKDSLVDLFGDIIAFMYLFLCIALCLGFHRYFFCMICSEEGGNHTNDAEIHGEEYNYYCQPKKK